MTNVIIISQIKSKLKNYLPNLTKNIKTFSQQTAAI